MGHDLDGVLSLLRPKLQRHLGHPAGLQHGLKFVVGPEAFARLSREADPFTAPDEVVANYADYYFEYTLTGPGLNDAA